MVLLSGLIETTELLLRCLGVLCEIRDVFGSTCFVEILIGFSITDLWRNFSGAPSVLITLGNFYESVFLAYVFKNLVDSWIENRMRRKIKDEMKIIFSTLFWITLEFEFFNEWVFERNNFHEN